MSVKPATSLPSSTGKRVADRLGVAVSEVQQMAQYMQRQIRHMDSMTAFARLIMEVPQVAKAYGARYDLGEFALAECIRLITKEHGHLAIEEIALAYRRWAAGKIKVTGGEMYGGEFSAAQLGKVLTAYSEERLKLAAAIANERAAAEAMEAEALRMEEKRAAFELEFDHLIEKLRRTAQSWEDVPAFWYNSLKTRGRLQMDMEAAMQIWEKAQVAAKQETTDARLRMEAIITDTEPRAKVIARKMAVWQWLQNK